MKMRKNILQTFKHSSFQGRRQGVSRVHSGDPRLHRQLHGRHRARHRRRCQRVQGALQGNLV